MKPSPCGRFLVLEALHLDSEILGALARWGERRGLRLQDAIQLAVVFFTEHGVHASDEAGIAPRPTDAKRSE